MSGKMKSYLVRSRLSLDVIAYVRAPNQQAANEATEFCVEPALLHRQGAPGTVRKVAVSVKPLDTQSIETTCTVAWETVASAARAARDIEGQRVTES